MWEHEAFLALKQALTETPMLFFPSFVCPFHLEMDALDVGVGAALE